MLEEGESRLNLLAVLAVAAVLVGFILVIAADSLADNAENDYFEGRLDLDEYRGSLSTASNLWLCGEIAIGVGVILVALAVVNKESREFRAMRTRIEKDFYRKCPSCGSWNTKFVPNCSTCGVMLPPLSEFQRTEVVPRHFKEGP